MQELQQVAAVETEQVVAPNHVAASKLDSEDAHTRTASANHPRCVKEQQAREGVSGKQIPHVRVTASVAPLGSMRAGSAAGGYGEDEPACDDGERRMGAFGLELGTISVEGRLIVAYSSD